MAQDDQDLVQAFAALREEDRAAIPRWSAPVARGPRVWGGITRLAGLAAVAATLLLALLVSRPSPPEPAIAEWRSPTDFLLQTPGHELLAGYPVLGKGFELDEKGTRP